MGYTGGDVLEITYNHPTIGSGVIFCKSNEDFNLDPGGFRTNDDANSIASNGKAVRQINRVRGSVEGTIAWDMTDNDELDKLSQLAGNPLSADWTIESITGEIWGGSGFPVGDVMGNLNTALITLKLAFEGVLQKLT